MDTKQTIGKNLISAQSDPYSLKVGQLVIVDGKWYGEIRETMIGDGSFYRVEVDTDKPTHEYWTVAFDRQEVEGDHE